MTELRVWSWGGTCSARKVMIFDQGLQDQKKLFSSSEG